MLVIRVSEQVEKIVEQFPTPFHLYDEKGIRDNVKALKEEFKGVTIIYIVQKISSCKECEKVEEIDDELIKTIKEEDKILINFVSIENVNADVNLCNLKFKVLPNNKNVTALSYNVTDIAAWSEDKSDYRDVNYSIVNSKIVMY